MLQGSALGWLLVCTEAVAPVSGEQGASAGPVTPTSSEPGVSAGPVAPTSGEPSASAGPVASGEQSTSAGPVVSGEQSTSAEPVVSGFGEQDVRDGGRVRLAIGGLGGVSFGLYPLPSGDASLFVGATLPVRAAIGYRGGLSVGEAEFAPGLVTHRHHLAVIGFVGPRQRALLGGGFGVKVVGGRNVGVEGAFQLGYAALTRSTGALVVGAEARYGGFVCDGCASLPYPQFGVFAGWLRLPGGPSARPVATVPSHPPRGLGLLIPGAILLGAVGAVIVTDLIVFAGTSECHGCVPLTLYATPALVPGLPLTIVGAIRWRRYKEWRDRTSFTPRPTGFTVQF